MRDQNTWRNIGKEADTRGNDLWHYGTKLQINGNQHDADLFKNYAKAWWKLGKEIAGLVQYTDAMIEPLELVA